MGPLCGVVLSIDQTIFKIIKRSKARLPYISFAIKVWSTVGNWKCCFEETLYLETMRDSGKLLSPEKIQGVKMPDLDHDENFEGWSDLFLRIRWHSCYINSTYYEVELFDDSLIRFKYEGNTLKEKSLSEFEENAIRKILKKLKFEVMKQVKEPQIRMTPDVPLKLSLRTRTTYLELHWHSSDEENYPENFNNFGKLARSIEEMIDVDKSELLLPIYE